MFFRAGLRIAAAMTMIAYVAAAPSVGLAARGEIGLAYQTESSSQLREAGKAGLVEVARIVRPNRGGGAVSVAAVLNATSAGAESAELQSADLESAGAVSTDGASGGADAASDVDLAAGIPAVDYATVETTSHNNKGLHLLAPAGWEVLRGSFGTVFDFAIPDTEFTGFVQSMGDDDLPGVLAVVLFRSQPKMFVTSVDPEAELLGVDTFMTDQQLPVTKISLTADFEGAPAEGAIYLVSPGTDAFVLIGFAEPGIWPELEPGVDLIAESIFFDSELITLTTAENGPLPYRDSSGVLSWTAPEGWQVAETYDLDFPLVVVDPDFTIAGILGMGPEGPAEEGFDLDALLPAEGEEPDARVTSEAVEAIRTEMDVAPEEFVVDESLSRLFPAEESAVLRFGGQGRFDDDIESPVVIYLKLDAESMFALLLFGDVDDTLEQESAILDLIGSVEAQ